MTQLTWRRVKLSCTWHVKSGGRGTHFGVEQRDILTIRSSESIFVDFCVFFGHILRLVILVTSSETGLNISWVPQIQSVILLQAMACSYQGAGLCLSQYWPIFTLHMTSLSHRKSRSVNPSLRGIGNRFNTLRPRQNGRHFPDDIFKYIFLNENIWIWIKISLKFVSKGSINNIPALDQIMAWRRPGDKPLSEPMMVRLPTHICVTRPQWVKIGPD